MTRLAWRDGLAFAALAAAAVGLALCFGGLFIAPRSVIGAWLTVALFLLGLPLGALALLMVHGLTGGRWGEAMRPALRATVATLPLAFLLLVPVLFRLDLVFPWAGDDPSTLSEAVRQKLPYLNVPFFVLRSLVCAALWLVLGWLLLGWTAPDTRDRARGGHYSAGLIVHALALTVFSIDWMLSLEPDFYSTIYAMLEASAEVVGAASLAMLVLAASRSIEAIPGGDETTVLGEDVANMLFAFMLMWAYLAFMQWLIVWAGDLPDEIHWYLIRSEDGWQYLLLLLIALQFAVPFAGFLMRSTKRSHSGLIWLAALVLTGHFVDVAWRIRPPLAAAAAPVGWPDLAALLGAGGLWSAVLIFALRHPERLVLLRRRLVRG